MKKKHKVPAVTFRTHEPLQDYYTDGAGNWYSVAKLLDDTKDLPVFDCPLSSLDLSGDVWSGCNMAELAHHVRRVVSADVDTPILIDWLGRVADGRHRIIRALVDGKRTIKARRMTWRADPCKKDA